MVDPFLNTFVIYRGLSLFVIYLNQYKIEHISLTIFYYCMFNFCHI